MFPILSIWRLHNIRANPIPFLKATYLNVSIEFVLWQVQERMHFVLLFLQFVEWYFNSVIIQLWIAFNLKSKQWKKIILKSYKSIFIAFNCFAVRLIKSLANYLFPRHLHSLWREAHFLQCFTSSIAFEGLASLLSSCPQGCVNRTVTGHSANISKLRDLVGF